MDDPYDVLGVRRDATLGEIQRAYRALVRRHHPDRYGDVDAERRLALHERMASITAAYRMVTDPKELERFERLRHRRRSGPRASQEPGRDGVHFTAGSPHRRGAVEFAPGDPDFDYRERAVSEFRVSSTPLAPLPRWFRKRPRGRRRR